MATNSTISGKMFAARPIVKCGTSLTKRVLSGAKLRNESEKFTVLFCELYTDRAKNALWLSVGPSLKSSSTRLKYVNGWRAAVTVAVRRKASPRTCSSRCAKWKTSEKACGEC